MIASPSPEPEENNHDYTQDPNEEYDTEIPLVYGKPSISLLPSQHVSTLYIS